jgi:hypothetical protein
LSHIRQAYFPFVDTEVTGASNESRLIKLGGTPVDELFTVGFASSFFENAFNGEGAVVAVTGGREASLVSVFVVLLIDA